jgi:hypothetical protein
MPQPALNLGHPLKERPKMSIDNLTIGQFKELSALLQPGAQAQAPADLQFGIGKKVIIRTYSAGVWFGLLTQKAGNEVILHGARRLPLLQQYHLKHLQLFPTSSSSPTPSYCL